MTEKNQDKKKWQSAFASLNDDNNLSAGVCGPDAVKLIGAKLRKMSKMIKNNLDIMPENAVLYFDNDWCAQCYSETNVVKEFAQIVGDAVHFYEINVNEKPELATKFAVWSAPSIVL
ncbi:thioredoxin family protein [Lactobacillus helveticus]|nr:thioredoxin domain-containing protein [Lactobacillus helveticus]NRO89076.1 Thioredoxin [Lactobacillus helveticus]